MFVFPERRGKGSALSLVTPLGQSTASDKVELVDWHPAGEFRALIEKDTPIYLNQIQDVLALRIPAGRDDRLNVGTTLQT